MKTTEEWMVEFKEINRAFACKRSPTTQQEKDNHIKRLNGLFKAIQLDAYKAGRHDGMTESAEICKEYASGEHVNLHIQAILTARDKVEKSKFE